MNNLTGLPRSSLRLLVSVLTGITIALAAAPARAQTLYGSIVGVVNDAQKGVVPGATVTIVNKDTNLRRETTTDEEGNYRLLNVLAGPYDVTVALEGFREGLRTNVPVTVGQISRVDVTLEIGALTETVTVQSASELLQTDKADLHTELKSAELTSLPLNQYRNYQALLNLVPGTSPMRFQNAETDFPQRSMTTNVNGTSNWGNATRTDGAANVNVFLTSHEMYVSPTETIETVNVSTNSFDAEQGMAGGAAVTVVTKTGTNQFKGSLFEFFNSDKLNAKPFFIGSGPRPPKLPIERHNYGGTLGGPVRRDQLFFFGSYEGYRSSQTLFQTYNVPDAALRNGDFSSARNADGSLQLVYDPFSGAVNGTGRTPLQGNVIPPEQINGIAKRILALYPLPNRPGSGAGGLTGNYGREETRTTDRRNVDVKVNWNRTAAHQLWWKASYLNALVDDQATLAVASADGDGGRTTVHQYTTGQTWVLGRGLLLDSTVGFSRQDQRVLGPDFLLGNVGLTELGIPGTNDQGANDARYAGYPGFVNGFTNIGGPNFFPLFRDYRTLSLASNLTKVRGRHEFKGGYTAGWYFMDQFQPDFGPPRGSFTFAMNATALRGGQIGNFYNQYAAFLLGLVGTANKSLQNEDMTSREWQHAFFLRDRWTVSPKITVDLGLRWEYYPIMVRENRGLETVDLNTLDVLLGGRGGNSETFDVKASKDNFAPRLGFVYRMNEKTILRTGYGVTYDSQPWARMLKGWYPVTLVAAFTQPEQFSYYGTPDQGIPTLVGPNLDSGRFVLPSELEMRFPRAGDVDRALLQSWNVAVERRLPGSVSLEAAYVGTRTDGGYISLDVNAVQTLGSGDLGRPYASMGRLRNLHRVEQFNQSRYHALQLAVNRPFTKGLMLKGQYTLSRARNYADGAEGDANLRWTTPSELERNWALADFDRTHNLQMAFIYQLPWRSGSSANVFRAIVDDWQINGVFAAFSGTPFTITADGSILNTPGNLQTADLTGTHRIIGDVGVNGYWFDPAAFSQPQGVRFGNTGRNQFRGPGAWNLDLSVFRAIPMGSARRLEVRVEASNVTNTKKYGNPTSNLQDGNFGRILGTLGLPYAERQVRLGLRFSF